MSEGIKPSIAENKKSIIKVDGSLKKNEINLVRDRYLEDRDKLFQETRSGVLRRLINNDYRNLSLNIIGVSGIKKVQEYLFKDEINKTGNKNKYADGVFGPGTFRKLIDFQKKQKELKVDGIAGNSVLDAITKLDKANAIISNGNETKENVIVEKEKVVEKFKDDVKPDDRKVDDVKVEGTKKDEKVYYLKDIARGFNIQNELAEVDLINLGIEKIKLFSKGFTELDLSIKHLDLNNPKELRELLISVDKFINEIIKYKSDIDNYGTKEYWATTKDVILRGSGDCEDFALLKKEILIRYGVDENNLKILHGRTKYNISHIALSYDFKNGEEPLVLDSGNNGVNSSELYNRFLFNQSDIKDKMTHSELINAGVLAKLYNYLAINNDGKFLDTLI